MIKLSKRLQAVADLVDPDCYLADVGSDHAMLPIYLLQKGTVKWVQAIENKMAPYLRMKGNIEGAGFSSHVLCTLGDGLTSLSPEVTGLTICGIGGLLTCQILEKDPSKLQNIHSIILDPHRDLVAVRERVSQLHFHLIDETMVYEDKIYYSIMKWAPGDPVRPYSEDELLFGPFLMLKRGEIYKDYIKDQRQKVNVILNGGLPKDKREYYLNLYRRITAQL
jgi:tRNA (adenine22-N1)-methyltransferase